jgi:NAD(P)-dependent dehydrogenase (short-subunit alcohol dehydrogenase family)
MPKILILEIAAVTTVAPLCKMKCVPQSVFVFTLTTIACCRFTGRFPRIPTELRISRGALLRKHENRGHTAGATEPKSLSLTTGESWSSEVQDQMRNQFERAAAKRYVRAMQIQGKVAIVTEGSRGIGRAMCRMFAAEGAGAVVVADPDREAGLQVAKEINGFFVPCNAAQEADVQMLVEAVLAQTGRIDIFCSTASPGEGGGLEASNKQWQGSWQSSVMAQVHAARAVVPHMLERKEGYWLQALPVSDFGSGAAAGAVAAFAALGFARWLAGTYRDQGIRVCAFLPGGLATNGVEAELESLAARSLSPDELAARVMDAVRSEQFLLAPHVGRPTTLG